MTTLAEHMIVVGAENRPPMLDKRMYNSWQSRMLLYIKGKKNGRMMLESIENRPLVYPTINKMVKFVTKDMSPTRCLYSPVNHFQSAKDIRDRVKLLMQGAELSYQEREFQVNTKFFNALQPEWSKFVTDVKLAKNMYSTNYGQLYAYLSQHEGHENEVRMLRERYPDPLALVANYQTQSNSAHHTPPLVPQNAYHTPLISQQPQVVFPQLDSGLVVPSFLPGDDPITCINKAMAFMSTIMASRTGTTENVTSSKVLDEEQLAFLAHLGVVDVQVTQTTISQNAAFQTDDLDAYDSDRDDKSETKTVNESLTAKLERYKERVKTFEQRLNVDLSSREKLIDSQIDDMIQKKNALKQEIDSLKQTLSKQVKEKESLLQTCQSAQTVHMLTELQSFYDATHKQALSNQNPFYHKKAQRIKPTLYDGFVISKKHDVFSVVDEEETLILEEESR
ncbi:hypothetical protein Tco_0859816 [Tanacetum coccineum]|uniref:Integrase, catalytic region, zinc finger, CCHC-type, peptidase aspartic, catalytic n=1 Tax=Tanacetum coccineum TaxID=301880 RepID=A0ABQ5BIS7_9ASTR